MFTRIRPLAAVGLLGCAVVGSARADGDVEKPPGVPPEVQAAKCSCPTLHGPCFGFYPTHWRVLSDCCSPPGPITVAPARPTTLPPTPATKPAPKPRPVEDKTLDKPGPRTKFQQVGGCGSFVMPDDRERGMFPPPDQPTAVELVPSAYNPKK